MTTSPTSHTSEAPHTDEPVDRVPLRLDLHGPSNRANADGTWWPQSRNLLTEAADLVDSFPPAAGHINRLLFSRPDWDDALVAGGGGVRRVMTRRGWVKMGSFPSDDTQLMVLAMASGQRLRLAVVHADQAAAPA